VPKNRKVRWAGLQLLDRQIIDRDGKLCGNVDDLELTPTKDGKSLYVSAIHSGPGALSFRLGHRTLGAWLQRMHEQVDTDPPRLRPIPFDRVTELGSAITVDAPAEELPASAVDKWVGDHVITHIPGANRAAE
jgi:sporulation protein YlmC with PRC-barrel domain